MSENLPAETEQKSPRRWYEIEHPKKRGFLLAYVDCCTVRGAAEAADISHTSHYRWLKDDAEYAEAFEEARRIAADRLEDIAIDRAKEKSDTLLIFLLKGMKPGKYADRHVHSGDKENPIEFTLHLGEDQRDGD